MNPVLGPRRAQLPHLDGSVQTTGNKIFAAWGKGNTVDTVLVSIWALKTLNQSAVCNVPHADALVQGTGCDQQAVWRDGNSSDTVFNGKGQDAVSSLNVPETDCAIAAPRSYSPAVTREVQTVDILFVAGKCVPDCAVLDIPDLVDVSIDRFVRWELWYLLESTCPQLP